MAARARERTRPAIAVSAASAMPLTRRAVRSRRWVSVSRSWHQSKTSACWRRSAAGAERQLDGFPAEFGVAGDLVVERPGEAGLGHGSAAGHERLELLPARRCALAFALEQAEALRAQQEAGMLGEDGHRIVGLGGQRHAEDSRSAAASPILALMN